MKVTASPLPKSGSKSSSSEQIAFPQRKLPDYFIEHYQQDRSKDNDEGQRRTGKKAEGFGQALHKGLEEWNDLLIFFKINVLRIQIDRSPVQQEYDESNDGDACDGDDPCVSPGKKGAGQGSLGYRLLPDPFHDVLGEIARSRRDAGSFHQLPEFVIVNVLIFHRSIDLNNGYVLLNPVQYLIKFFSCPVQPYFNV